MTDKTLPTLSASGSVAGTDLFLSRQAGTEDTKTTATQLMTYVGSVSLALSNKTFSTNVTPTTNDAAALGTTTLMWSDLFLASGGVVNWNNGDVLITHSSNTLAFTGASSDYTYDARNRIVVARTDVTVSGLLEIAGAEYSSFDWRPAANTGTVRFGIVGYAQHSTNNSITGVGHLGGILGYAQKTGTGTDEFVLGIEGRVGAISGIITLGAAVTATFDTNTENAGTITSAVGFYVPTQSDAGHITNKYAFFNNNTDWELRTNGPSTLFGKITQDTTITAPGTTGARTINKATGKVNFAAGATSLVVTNSLCTANSIVLCNQQSLDASMLTVNAIPDAGFFTLVAVGTPAAEVKVGFMVIN